MISGVDAIINTPLKYGRGTSLRQRLETHQNFLEKYIGDTGEELVIKGNRFTFTSAEESFHGGLSLYSLGENLLNMRIVDDNNLSRENRIYRYEFVETILDNSVQRILTLYPGFLGFYGFEQDEDDFLRFQQIEIVEEKDASIGG